MRGLCLLISVRGCLVLRVCVLGLGELGRKGLMSEGSVKGGGLMSVLRMFMRVEVKQSNWVCMKSRG